MRVPLLLRAPGQEPGRRDDPVSLVDLLPTLLNRVLGSQERAELPPEAPGRDLLAKGAGAAPSTPYFATLGGARVRRIGLVLGDYKLISTFTDGGRHDQLYRRSRATPSPAVLLDADPLKRELRGELSRLRRRYAQARSETKQNLTEEDLKNLRALGYAEGD